MTIDGAGHRRLAQLALAIGLALLFLGTNLTSAAPTKPPPATPTSAALSAQEETGRSSPTGHDEHAITAPTYDLTMQRIETASRLLEIASAEQLRLLADLDQAEASATELRGEASALAEETLAAAIKGYQEGTLPPSILGAEDLNANLRAIALGGAAIGSDTEAFDQYRSIRKDLEIGEGELTRHQARVDQSQTEIGILEDELAEEFQQLGELEERRIQQESAMVAVQASNRARARGRKQGSYLDTCPVNGPHEFIDSWGFARSGGRRHQGVDMLAPKGTEIVAPVSGFVELYSNQLGGRSFRLTDANGNYYYGTHMSGFGTEGQVRAGEVIGYVGDDGNAAGIDHLHFELHPGGRGNPLNPFLDTAAVCSGAQT